MKHWLDEKVTQEEADDLYRPPSREYWIGLLLSVGVVVLIAIL